MLRVTGSGWTPFFLLPDRQSVRREKEIKKEEKRRKEMQVQIERYFEFFVPLLFFFFFFPTDSFVQQHLHELRILWLKVDISAYHLRLISINYFCNQLTRKYSSEISTLFVLTLSIILLPIEGNFFFFF